MNSEQLPFYDPLDKFDDIPDISNTDPGHIQSFKDLDDLVTTFTFHHINANLMQNQLINNSTGTGHGPLAMQMPLPTAFHQRQSPNFDLNLIDYSAEKIMMNSTQQINVQGGNLMQNQLINNSTGTGQGPLAMQMPLPTAFSQRQSPNFDLNLIDYSAEEIMMNSTQQINVQGGNLVNGSESMNWECTETVEDCTLPWENEYQETNSSSGIFVCSPVDTLSQQSSSYNRVELQYQQIAPPQWIRSPTYDFGSTQLAPYMPTVHVAPTCDVEAPSIKKTVKKRQNVPSSTPPPTPFNMNEWYINEGNGRRRRPLLFEFILQLLNNPNYSHIAQYVDKRHGTFKFYQRERAAELWGLVKGRNGSSKMTYEKLARGIRYYYSTQVIRPTPGRFTFRFGPPSGFSSTLAGN